MIKQMQILLKNSFARYLVAKLPPPSKRFGLDTVRSYYQDILGLLPSKFCQM